MTNETYKRMILADLERLGVGENGETFLIKFVPGDYKSYATRANLFERAKEKMPDYFLKAWCGVKSDEPWGVVPVFNPCEQAAWDAALSTYCALKEKALKSYTYTD